MALIPLRAGPLEMVFDDAIAFLRHLRYGDREIVRGIFAVVRNHNWDTIAATVDHLKLETADRHFAISFDVAVQAEDIDFRWHGTVSGREDGTVTFGFDGIALKSFLKNRIGLCVLHPIDPCAGQPCRVGHTDGSVTDGVFPRFISPHQPFKNIRSITHAVTDDVTAEVVFEGDVFEMEDQRNWTDASYKSYSTPLDLPFPVRMDAGQQIRQAVNVRVDGDLTFDDKLTNAPRKYRQNSVPNVSVDWQSPRTPPSIGLAMATSGRPLSPRTVELLAATAPGHLRVDLSLTSEDWPQHLREAAELAAAMKASLQIALFLSDAAERELDQLIEQLVVLKLTGVAAAARSRTVPRQDAAGAFTHPHPLVGLWMLFHVAEKSTRPQWIELASRKLAAWDPAVPVAAGTNAYFAELNRGRPQSDSKALPCFSISPQVHAFDNLSLVETLGAQRSTVETARQFSTHPVVISPITLRPRINPNATELTTEATPQSDPRQSTAFGAAWTAGSLARLATCPGIHSLTYYETAGPRGTVDDDGQPYAMYHVFKAIAGCGSVYECRSDQPLRVDALALSDCHGHCRVILASFSADPQRIVLRGAGGNPRLRPLSPVGFAKGTSARAVDGSLEVELPSESVVMIELECVIGEPGGFEAIALPVRYQ